MDGFDDSGQGRRGNRNAVRFDPRVVRMRACLRARTGRSLLSLRLAGLRLTMVGTAGVVVAWHGSQRRVRGDRVHGQQGAGDRTLRVHRRRDHGQHRDYLGKPPDHFTFNVPYNSAERVRHSVAVENREDTREFRRAPGGRRPGARARCPWPPPDLRSSGGSGWHDPDKSGTFPSRCRRP